MNTDNMLQTERFFVYIAVCYTNAGGGRIHKKKNEVLIGEG
jgi:hypothetical protein